MTAIFVLNLKSNKSVIVCADRQESGFLIDYNNIQEDNLIEIEGKVGKYCSVDLIKRYIGTNHSNKIVNVLNKFIFVGSELSNDLNEIFKFIEANITERNLIKKVTEFKLINSCAFVLIEIDNLKIHYFSYGEYSLFKEELLIFGDVKQTKEIEDNLQICIEKYNGREILFDQIAFALHELSQKNYNRTIASPFHSGCNLTLIKKNNVDNFKLKNYFRWEHD